MGGLPKRAGLFFCSLPWCYCRGSRRKRCCPSGPSASLHPPTPYGAVPPAYGRGWPGSSGQHRLRPCTSAPSLPLRCACGSLLRPRVARVLQDNTAYDHALGLHLFKPDGETAPQWNRISLGLSRWPPVLKPWLSGRSMSVRAAPLRIRSFSSGRYFW